MSQLQFKSIAIDNFKTFSGSHKFELARQPGLYYITGKNLLNPELGANGVGKSTLWDALTWVLWGKTGRDNKPAAAITPWGTKGTTKVELHFIRNGKSVVMKRERNPNRLAAMTEDNPEGGDIVQEDVPKLLGMTEEMFRRTLVLGQFGTLFLDLKPEAQGQMFTEALSLDIWNKASATAGDAAKAASRTKERAEAELSASVQLLEGIAGEITDAEKASALFEQDKAARIKKIKTGIETLQGDLNKLEEAPLLKPPLPDQSKSQELNKQLSEARSALEIALADRKRLGVDLERAQARADLFKATKKKTCPECGQEISAAEYKEKKEAADAALADADDAVVQKLNDIAEMREKGLKLKADYDKAVEKESHAVDAYDDALSAYNDYQAEVQAVRAELQRQRRALSDEEGSQNTHEASLARLRTRRQTYRASQGDLKEKAAQAAKESAEADFWVAGFREIRLSIIDRALTELQMAAANHAAMLGLDDWGIKFDTERETQSGKVNYSFTVLLYPPGQKEPVKWESYSGGESQRWQLAVAFALSEVLLARAGLAPNLEVLDEPTRGLSADGVADLLDHLRDRALELGRAVYFVDHHSLDKGAFDGTLVVEKGKKGSSFRWS